MAEQKKKSGVLRRFVGDPLVSLGKGIIGAGEAVMGGANLATHGLAGRGWAGMGYDPEAARQYLDSLYSPEQRRANEAVENARGIVNTANAMMNNPSTMVHTGIEAAPVVLTSMGGGQAAARLAPGAAAAAPRAVNLAGAGLAEGAYGAAQEAERIRQAGAAGTLADADALNRLDAVAKRGMTDTAIGAAGRVFNAGRNQLGAAMGAAQASSGTAGHFGEAVRRRLDPIVRSEPVQGLKSEGTIENVMQRGIDEVGGFLSEAERKKRKAEQARL